MFGLFTRPSRRPRTVRRTPARPALRVEALEARANPAAPVMANVSVTWSDPSDAVVRGTIIDASPATTTIQVTGGGTAAVLANKKGVFSIAVQTDGVDPIFVQAVDNQGLYSGMMEYTYGVAAATAVSQSNGGAPVITNVTITCIDGVWHIRGQVLDDTPIATIIQVTSSIPGVDGKISPVINADGSFDIAITLDPSSPGGSISIVAINNDNGLVSQEWDGSID